MLLSLNDISISFNKRKILDSINLEIGLNPITSISGKSGSGKTTLLSIISGLLKPDRGRVLFGEKNIYKWTDFSRSKYRNRKVGSVFQSFNLLPEFTVHQNIIYPAILNPRAGQIGKHAGLLMDYLGIENIRNQLPHTLSGGEKQRTAIARAMINNPDIILADEPTGNLDTATGKSIFSLFRKIQQEYNIFFIIATHDKYIIKNSDVHYLLDNGALIKK